MPPRGRKGAGKKPSPRTKAASPAAVVEEKTVQDSESLPTIVDDETPVTGDVSVDKAETAASIVSAETVEERNDTVEEKNEIVDEKNEIVDEKTEIVVETTETVVETVVIKETTATQTVVEPTSESLEVSSMDPVITEKGEEVAEDPEAIKDGLEGPNSEPLIEDEDEALEDAEEILDGTVGPTLEPANEENEDEDPEEIEDAMDGEDRNGAFPMEQDQAISGANQEIRVGEAQDTEGGGTDVAGPSEDGGKSASDEEDEHNEEEDEAALCMHAPLSERKKQKEFEIFVGGLDKEAVEEDLVKVFGQFGEIQSARIVKHQTTQKSKGFAFIRYTTVEQAKKALTELKDGVEVRGKRVGISASQENDTLYIGNICKTWTKEQILETLKGYGIEQLEEIYLPEDPKTEGNSKGFALLEFSTHSDAMAAFQRLRKPDAVFGCDRSAKVSFAQSSMHPSEEALSQVKTVFVEGLPNSWDEQKVNEHCKQYGEIEKIQLSRNFTTARRKDFGFISFTSRESAVACVEGINTAQIGEGEVKVKANLAKPQNKGRLAKQGARGGFRVKNEGESTDGAHLNKAKGHAKFKGLGAKGKGPMSMRTGRGGQPPRPHGRGTGAQGGAPFHDPQRRKQQFKGGKPGGRGGPSNYNARPANKGRGNMQGRPTIDTGKHKNSRFGKPKGNYPSRPAPYRESYAPGYGAPATGYQGRGYGASSGSKRQYSDMDPHAGYHGPAAKQGRDSYGYGQRSAGGYNNHANTTVAGYSGGSVAQPSYGTDYSNYTGYEQAGYAYPSGSGAYPPNSGAYPPNTGAYPPNTGAYPPNSGAYPPNAGAYPPNSGTYPPSDTGVYPPSGGAYPPSDGGAYPPHGQYY